MRFAIFPLQLSKVPRLPRKSDARSYEVLHLSQKNHLSKPEDLRLQNGTPLRKSTPGHPNSFDEHVPCTAPATENAKILHFDFEMCFAPQRRAPFRHLNFEKWSEHGVFRTF